MSTTTTTTATTTAKTQLSWLNRINLVYAAAGLALLFQVSGVDAAKSFLVGWVIAVLNLEILKRIGVMLLEVFKGATLHPVFYVFLFGKFAFWGMVIALFSQASWIQGIPFALGMSTLLISGLGLGVRESLHAR